MKCLCVQPMVSAFQKWIGFALVLLAVAWCQAGPAPAGAPDPDEIMRILEQERVRREKSKQKSPLEQMAEKLALQERIKRRETRLVMSNLIRQGGLLAKDDPDQAASLYQNAIRMGLEIEVNARQELEAARMGLTGIRLQQARQAQKSHKYLRANGIAESILIDIPNSPDALAFKRQNERAQAAYQKSHPSSEASYRVKELRERREYVAKLLHDARYLYELRDYMQAQKKFRQVIALDAVNDIAQTYLSKISKQIHKEAVMARERGFDDKLNQVDRAWTEPERNRGRLPVPNPFYKRQSGAGARPNQGRVQMLNKLQSIVVPQMNALDKFSMIEVVELLDSEIRKLDPDLKGVNFTIDPIISNAVPAQALAFANFPQGARAAVARQMVTGVPEVPVDPQSGLPRNPNKPVPNANPLAAPRQPQSMSQTVTTFDPALVKVRGLTTPLRELTAVQLLEVITKSFDTPITYTITDHSVELRYKQPQNEKLFSRGFRINANTFGQGMGGLVPTPRDGDTLPIGSGYDIQRSAFNDAADPRIRNAIPGGGTVPGGGGGGTGGGGTGVPTLPGITTPVNNVAASGQARTFFQQLGIPMGPNVQIFFNGRSGDLLVRAPLGTLELIEQVIEVFNASPPQLQIEAKFAEIAHNHGKSLGFDWFLGQSRTLGGKLINSPGSAPSMIGKPTRNNPSGFFPYPGTLINDQFMPMPRQGLPSGTILPDAMEGALTQGWKGYGNPLFTLTGILTDPQFRMVINALDETDAAELLSAPKVTTLSGVQARLSVQDQRTVVTGGSATGQPGAGGGALGGGGGAGSGTINFTPQQMQFGPSLDVIPYVTADGFTIEMSLMPSISEFLGYESSEFEMQALSGGNTISQSVPMPRFRQRQIASNCIVWDGQILMLGGLISDTVQINKDKIPFLGDIPFLGRLFRGEGTKSDKKNMMIFVKPTIIDPAGNRVNTPETLPYSATEVPPQMPMTPAP